MTKEEKASIIAQFATKPGDVGSSKVQVAVMSARIKELTSHMKEHPTDFSSRRGLLAVVSKRKKLLSYLNHTDHATYLDLIAKLGLKK